MGILDHWHPVCQSKALGKDPLGVKINGTGVALFRTASGQLGALNDMCPHRRMRLSLGRVVGERLMCKYHGWSFTCDGQGESPGTPKLHACASEFDVTEKHGFIWVKSKQSNPVFPEINPENWYHMCSLEHRIQAPLDVSVDNFCEIEHTPTVHDVFGYQLDQMRDVTVRFEPTETTVRVINQGPPKRLGFLRDAVMGIRKNYVFNDDWTTHFSPVYSVYDHWWSHKNDPKKEAYVRWRLYMFFWPEEENITRVTTFCYARSSYRLPGGGGLWLYKGVMRRQLWKEIQLDVEIVEQLASHDPSLEGMKLSRFDKSLALNRERIQRIYRGVTPNNSRTTLRLAE